ncbi:MAG: AAA family ATPase [Xanthobacteraceae bacterium]
MFPASAQPRPATLDRLTHEYSLKDELDGAWAVRPLELLRDRGRTVLLLDDPGGELLSGRLGTPMDVGRFLRIAIGIAAAIGKVHRHGLIHKDIKPANILVNGSGGEEVRLTGFGIASRLPRERQAPEPPESIAGTLAYMSPEQTGRMNRAIDFRSDLYSFGVVLYQMATGAPPFAATDPMEWVHCHIARNPVPPSERLENVPPAVGQIIMKLLAKTPEERYQTAAGVEHDLRHCLGEWEARRWVETFALGQRDTPDLLLIPEKLYGRAQEVEALLAAFNRVVSGGTAEMVLVTGYSGIGKSSVVNELHRVLVPTRGLFASGKFDQYKRNIPYATLVQAFESLVRPLLGKSDAELARWRDAILEALGPNGRLMVDLVPPLKLIIGEQPPVPELPPQDAQRRFQLVFKRFIGVFARPEHPLALFLDDLQWLDSATLDFLEALLTQGDVRHLALIGAYRDNEVDDVHPLIEKFEAIKNSGGTISEIALEPLGCEHVGQLIADAFRCEPPLAARLAQLVHEKSSGNPFFVIQFLYALAEEGLLHFDHDALAWSWDFDRIHAKGYTDNVAELMAGKLSRLPAQTLTALQQLACLGNVAAIDMLSMVLQAPEQELDIVLWPALRQELVERLGNAYRFSHDRVHEAVYSGIPAQMRAEVHLLIGRLLVAQIPPERREEAIFDLVNQLNRGATLITSRDEREQVAGLNLIAGNRAKASAAYASALSYFVGGAELLDDDRWERRYALAFQLELQRVECELLSGAFEDTQRLLSELLAQARSRFDKAAAYRLQILFHVTNSAYQAAIDCGLECLRLFDVAIPAHPTREQIAEEYERVWARIRSSIETLIDLPLSSDPEHEAISSALTFLFAPASFTNCNLFYMLVCRGANLTLDHGTSEATTHIYSGLAQILGPIFHRYEDGLRFANLSHAIADKYGFTLAKAYFALQNATPWCRPINAAVDYARLGYRSAVESGDLTYACYFSFRLVHYLLFHGSRLDQVWSQSQAGIELARRIKFRDTIDIMSCQQAFIAHMRGETAVFSSFDSPAFNEAAFEASLTGDRMPMMVCWYWILKLQARLVARDFVSARMARHKARALVSAAQPFFQWANYVYFAALSIAVSLGRDEDPDAQADELRELHGHLAQLREWADACSTSFLDKYTLVAAEIARIEGRALDAMELYEQAIRSARANGFLHSEAIAYEMAAQFYAGRGFETFADAYLGNARDCYLRWGADGKVRQLDRLYPHLAAADAQRRDAAIRSPVEQLDAASVVKASQALSSEIVLPTLIERLMTIALENAGADRGLLILPAGDEYLIQAEARSSDGRIEVTMRQEPITPSTCPEALVRYVIRTQESVILDDAAKPNLFSAEDDLRGRQSKSILCLPLIKQRQLTGILFLENTLTSYAFTADRIAILELLAAQAAISLENTRLYSDLQERESKVRRLVESNIIGIYIFDLDGRIMEANEAFLRIVGYSRDDPISDRLRWTALTPPQWRDADERALAEVASTGTFGPFEKEYFRKDGSLVPVLLAGARFGESQRQGVTFVLDLTERKRAEESLRETERRFREVQMELAHANRVATMGQLTASIAHEVGHPVAATLMNAESAARWLGREPPDLARARQLIDRIITESKRAANIFVGIRDLVKSAPSRSADVEINEMILEVVALTRSEMSKNGVVAQMELADDLPPVHGDRVQLQQVILNLIVNAVEAMSQLSDGPRDMLIGTESKPGSVRVTVQDSGPGLPDADTEQAFKAFYTTKPTGLGMGLSICRSIVETHGGRLWAAPNEPRGAVFCFTLPVGDRTLIP